MKVLLTHAYYIGQDEKEKKINKPYPPLGLLSVGAYLEKEVDVSIFDSTFSTEEALFQTLKSGQYSIVGIYCNLMTKIRVLRIVQELKRNHPDCLIVLGGPDVRFNVQEYLENGADILVIGEGEETMMEIAQFKKAGRTDWENIKGIAFKRGQEIIENKERALIKSMDDLPMPAYDKIDVEAYLHHWKTWHGESMLNYSTQRGCPYTCKWCSTAVYGQSYRRKSPTRVVEELRLLKESHNPDGFWFVDDVFTVSHKWLEEFTIEVEKMKLDISFECISRADRMNEHVIQLLKRAGCFRIWIGAESGSQKILNVMDRRVRVEEVQENIRNTKKAGMEAGTFIMLGYPGETMEDIKDTIHHLVVSDPDEFTITLTYPIKGTKLYDEVSEISQGSFDWSAQTDRQRNFKRTYRDAFYKHAIRKVVNEVKYQQGIRRKGFGVDILKHKIKSQIAGLQMKVSR